MGLDLESFTKLLSLGFGKVYLRVGLTFANKDLNMAAIKFPPSKFEMLKNKNIYI